MGWFNGRAMEQLEPNWNHYKSMNFFLPSDVEESHSPYTTYTSISTQYGVSHLMWEMGLFSYFGKTGALRRHCSSYHFVISILIE